MKLGLHIASTTWDGGARRLSPTLIDVVEAADAAGFDAIKKTAPFGFDVGADGSKVGELLDQVRRLAGMRIETVYDWVVGVERITPIEVMGREVIPAAAQFGADLHTSRGGRPEAYGVRPVRVKGTHHAAPGSKGASHERPAQ